MPTYGTTFYNTVLKQARDKPELRSVPEVSDEDLGNMLTPEEGIHRRVKLSSILDKYYNTPEDPRGLEREVLRARFANLGSRIEDGGQVLADDSYSRIFEDIPVEIKSMVGGEYGLDTEDIRIPDALSQWRWERDWENKAKDDWELRSFFRTNSFRPESWWKKSGQAPPARPGAISQRDILEHEAGHYALRPAHPDARKGRGQIHRLGYHDPKDANYLKKTFGGSLKDWVNEKYGLYLNRPYELYQAAGRFQREMYAGRRDATGKGRRVTKPGEFTELVLSGKTPSFLSHEGRRILLYARDMLEDIDKNYPKKSFFPWGMSAEDRKKKFLNRLEVILPTTVKAEDVEQSSQIRRI